MRNFSIHFRKQQTIIFDLNCSEQTQEFKNYLHLPALSIKVNKATCYIPDERLKYLNVLDTAGLCSPVNFHTSITEELLLRHPDKLVVLLDSRRLDSETNRVA